MGGSVSEFCSKLTLDSSISVFFSQFEKHCCPSARRGSDSTEADSAVLSPLANGFCSLLPSCGSFCSGGHWAGTERGWPTGFSSHGGLQPWRGWGRGRGESVLQRPQQRNCNQHGEPCSQQRAQRCPASPPDSPLPQTAMPLPLKPYGPRRLQRAFLELSSK